MINRDELGVLGSTLNFLTSLKILDMKNRNYFKFMFICFSLALTFVACECIEEILDPPEEPTLAELAITSGDLIGTTTLENFDCTHWANLWGIAYSSCNVDVVYDNDQIAGGNILIRTADVPDLPEVAYTTFDESLNKLEFWETEFISNISSPDNEGVVTYFAKNKRPKVCDPNNPNNCATFSDAIVDPAETRELEGTAEIGVDRIWITW
jgi:hypothetical protein